MEHRACPTTIGRLLRQQNYGLRSHRKVLHTGKTLDAPAPEQRWARQITAGHEGVKMSESEPHIAASKPKRRWYQCSLRSLLVVATFVAVILAVFFAPTRTQRIVLDIQKMNGRYGLKKAGPTWFRECFGRSVPEPGEPGQQTTIGPFDRLSHVEFG